MKKISSQCKLCRREGEKLFLKGERCTSPKCAMVKKNYQPGFHGPKSRPKKLSAYGQQLREKQKTKRIYGILEKQFRGYFAKAVKTKGVTGHILLQFLERRLDNAVYRMGFAASRKQARQIVGHAYVHVNGKKVNIPSFLMKKGDEVEFRFKKKNEKFVKENIETSKVRNVPGWLNVEEQQFKGKVLRLPEREDIEFPVNEQLIVELYSR